MGSEVDIVIRAKHLLRKADEEAVELLEECFRHEGIRVHIKASLQSVENGTRVLLSNGEEIFASHILVALGRKRDFANLNLEAAGVACTDRGIAVDQALRTNVPHIFAVGDCNGEHEFPHAAMHQGMLALMNCMLPGPLKRNFRSYLVPSTIFTEPQISQVGCSRRELEDGGAKFEAVKVRYDDYGAAIAEGIATGFVKVLLSPTGRILGATVVGEVSADMINEWGLAIQKGLRMHSILMLQHSFPSMAFLNKRAAETWIMDRMRANSWMRRLARLMFRL